MVETQRMAENDWRCFERLSKAKPAAYRLRSEFYQS